jgi:hypothetical protein
MAVDICILTSQQNMAVVQLPPVLSDAFLSSRHRRQLEMTEAKREYCNFNVATMRCIMISIK